MKRLWCVCKLTSARSTKKTFQGLVRQSLVPREFVCLLGTLDPKHILTNHLSLCGPKFPVVFGACCFKTSSSKGRTQLWCVCVSFWNNIQKKERERPQKRDRVVKGITALKTTPTLNIHALERERESCCFRASSFSSFGRPLFLFLKALNGARVPLRI